MTNRKAKLKSTGEVVGVRVDMDYHGNTTWLDANSNTEYYPSELEFLPDEVDKTTVMQRVLSQFSDNDLKKELKRRENERRSRFPDDVRCRDCKHCGAGKTYPCTKTAVTVCLAKPKPKAGPDCYYATSLSCKVCEKFDSKY